MFIAVLFNINDQEKKWQVALKLGHLKPRLYGEIQLTPDNSDTR